MLICPYARTNISYSIIKLLLDQSNIDINLKCNIGNTALMLIPNCTIQHYNMESLELLLKHPDINVNIKNYYNHTIFDFLLLFENLDKNIIFYFLKQIENYNYLTRYLKICGSNDISNLQYIYKNHLYNQIDYDNLINTIYHIYSSNDIDKILIDKKIYMEVCQYKYGNIIRKINLEKKIYDDKMKLLNKDIYDIQKKMKNCNYELTYMTYFKDCTFIFH